jgi:hypothetical protein
MKHQHPLAVWARKKGHVFWRLPSGWLCTMRRDELDDSYTFTNEYLVGMPIYERNEPCQTSPTKATK